MGAIPARILFSILLAVFSQAQPAGNTEALETSLDRIQRECLRAYPPDLLAEMTSGKDEIPIDVESEPAGQMQFLSKEIKLEKGLFYPSLLEELLPAFRRYLQPGKKFLDLGSGDGRVLFLANVLGSDATGVEYDGRLVKVTRTAQESLGRLVDARRLHVVQGDFFELPWSGYDVVFYFDQSSFEQDRLREKIRTELDSDSRLIVAHEQAPFPGLEVEARFTDIKVYRRPVRNLKDNNH